MRWRKVTLIGVGLLGGSLGLALRKRGLADEIHGYVRRQASIAECARAGAVDHASTDLQTSVQDADLVVLCTPLAQMADLSRAIAPHLNPGTLITDVGSVKAALVTELEPIFAKANAHFIGSHPMAGSEKTGVLAARADLFQNAACVVTPTASSQNEKIAQAEELWRSVGGRVMRMSPEFHDLLVSRTSHLPHVLAANLASFVLANQHSGRSDQSKLCANGFRDTTRIASGSPEMWRDIAIMNRPNLIAALDEFAAQLAHFRKLLDDPAAVEAYFEHAKSLRDEWTSRCASPSPE